MFTPHDTHRYTNIHGRIRRLSRNIINDEKKEMMEEEMRKVILKKRDSLTVKHLKASTKTIHHYFHLAVIEGKIQTTLEINLIAPSLSSAHPAKAAKDRAAGRKKNVRIPLASNAHFALVQIYMPSKYEN